VVDMRRSSSDSLNQPDAAVVLAQSSSGSPSLPIPRTSVSVPGGHYKKAVKFGASHADRDSVTFLRQVKAQL